MLCSAENAVIGCSIHFLKVLRISLPVLLNHQVNAFNPLKCLLHTLIFVLSPHIGDKQQRVYVLFESKRLPNPQRACAIEPLSIFVRHQGWRPFCFLLLCQLLTFIQLFLYCLLYFVKLHVALPVCVDGVENLLEDDEVVQDHGQVAYSDHQQP